MTPCATPTTSLRIGWVALIVRDLTALSRYYQDVIGLRLLADRDDATGRRQLLGCDGRVLLELRHDPHAKRPARSEAGLFHTAFLLPSRAALADWLVHALAMGVTLDGASDHLVSEALYLTDPEGNGIEIYHDRERGEWPLAADGSVSMATLPLDLRALAAQAGRARFAGLPAGSSIGHVHLQVGDLDQAKAFYADRLGLAVMSRYPGALFFGADGYHHHLAANIWNSRGAGPRADGTTGLAEIALIADTPGFGARLGAAGDSVTIRDPWGTSLSVHKG
ncbi:VOC family protein [Paracoccus alkenifer]|uniref:Catechol 2,3-dioxygenase n=1 Tax=Paracoccus alkenifer TaxID=65735 RepID=A0A1H6NQS7_9RHOB|nr:VOC family protein [Paracoccus alkenifer]SEI13004.1 catechol 2,3-dioxygenase [Paracoccus alkenifer]